MVVVVFNCFHWMGYHCTRQLLYNGHEVVGVDEIDTPLKEKLYMYVGRNSHFQHFNTIEERDNHSHHSKNEPWIKISQREIIISTNGNSDVALPVPPLFGEWMKMESQDIETIDDLKLWILAQRAKYVGDFFEVVIDHLEKGEVSSLLEINFSNTARATQPQEILERVWEVTRHKELNYKEIDN
ncbi:hypothetical protein [Halobacillus sp. Marseille-P3879]|uniref:hypothetical protein n=1 Tax=Halobacillus TaxID=45667 RepID=UPI000C7CECF7|nr:hypothetical protein [Halobacillus sp. Marseille-P3879]